MWVLVLISDEIELRSYDTVHVHGLQSPSLSGELYNEAQTADGTSHWFALILAPNSSSTTRCVLDGTHVWVAPRSASPGRTKKHTEIHMNIHRNYTRPKCASYH